MSASWVGDAAQAVLTATDTALSKAWRDEERAWRQADLAWRQEELAFMCVSSASPVPARPAFGSWVLACLSARQTSCEAHLHTLSSTNRQQQAAWRAQDLEQRHLENARTLWMRAVEKNRCCGGPGIAVVAFKCVRVMQHAGRDGGGA